MQGKRWVSSLLILAMMAVSGLCEERAQADLEVKSVDVSISNNRLVCNVTVDNEHDDHARKTELKILLPVGVRVIGQSIGCQASLAVSDHTQGVVTCKLGELGINDPRTVRVTTTLPPANVPKQFAAFASSNTPDPNPSNNFKIGGLQ